MSKPKFVYVTYIRTTPEKLWSALTDPQTRSEEQRLNSSHVVTSRMPSSA